MAQKVYLDDDGNPIGTGTGVRLDDQGNAITGADTGAAAPAGVPEQTIGRVASKAWENINPMNVAAGLGQMVTHPIDTAVALAGSRERQRGNDAFARGDVLGGLGQYARGVPLVGPMVAPIYDEAAGGDYAGALGDLIGLAAGPKVYGLAGRAVGAAGRAAVGAVGAEALEAGAASRVADVMSPRANTNVGRRMGVKAAKIAPELAKDPEVTRNFSRQGMQQTIGAKLTDAELMLDEANDARLSARTFKTEPIIHDLEARRREFASQPIEASQITPRDVPSPDLPKVEAHNARVARADRDFVVRWLADDLEQSPFQRGGSTPGQRADAFENYRPGDPESSKYAIGAGTGRVPGTPTQEMFHAVGIKGTRPQIAARLDRYLKGSPDPKLDALGDAMKQAFNGEKFDFSRLTDDQLEALGPGIKRSELRMPRTMPDPNNVRADVLARWFPEVVDFEQMPMAEQAVPGPTKAGVPVGEEVVPGPSGDRVGMIDKAISELRRLGPDARYEELRKIRGSYDGPAKLRYNPAMTPDFLRVAGAADGAADVTGVLREHLAKFDPQTAAANAQYSLYKSAHDILAASEEIERVRPKVGRQIMARLTATLLGGQQAGVPGAVAGYVLGPSVDAMVNSGVTTKLRTAKVMQELAAAIRAGSVGRVASAEARLKVLLKQGAVPVGASLSRTSTAAGSPQ